MKNNKKNTEISKIVLENVKYLAKCRNLKYGELEKKAEVAEGYIARSLSHNSVCGITFIYRCSQILQVSIDELCDADFIERERAKAKNKRIAELEAELKALKGETA